MEVSYPELARRAIEHVKALEEPYRSLAFQTILEDLVSQTRSVNPVAKALIQEPARKPADPVDGFMSRVMDTAKYDALFAARGSLCEKALAVLKLTKDVFEIDGLTAGQIANILIRKFRVAGVYPGHVVRDLGNSLSYVQILGSGRHRKFLLMTGGERHLEETIQSLLGSQR